MVGVTVPPGLPGVSGVVVVVVGGAAGTVTFAESVASYSTLSVILTPISALVTPAGMSKLSE